MLGGLPLPLPPTKLMLMVLPVPGGKGVGRGLLERVLSWSTTSAVTKLSLAVYAHNMPAIALYRSCGFTEEGRRVAEYRFPDGSFRDDLLMARTVGSTPL